MLMALALPLWGSAALAAPTAPPEPRVLVQQALDEPTRITLENIKLGEALRVITEQTGVELVMAPEVMRLVPYGAETRVRKVNIANIPLREGLRDLFSGLGMTFAVREDHVEIIPKEALRSLGRAPTWTELRTLKELSEMHPGVDADALSALRPRFQFRVPVPGAWQLLADAVRNVGAGPGDEVLTAACTQLGWGWFLSEDRIIVAPLEQQIRRRLQQPISVRLEGRPMFEVMAAVGRAVHVAVRTEPGALASLPPSVQRHFSLSAEGQTAEEVFETIAAYTGLGYLIEPDGVLFFRTAGGNESPRNEAEFRVRANRPDPYVGKIVIPLDHGMSIEWLIRRSELPEDLRHQRERDLEKAFEAVRSKRARSPS